MFKTECFATENTTLIEMLKRLLINFRCLIDGTSRAGLVSKLMFVHRETNRFDFIFRTYLFISVDICAIPIVTRHVLIS